MTITWDDKSDLIAFGRGRAEMYTIRQCGNQWICSSHFGKQVTTCPSKTGAKQWCQYLEDIDTDQLFLISKVAYFKNSIVTNSHIDRQITIYCGEEFMNQRVAEWHTKHPNIPIYVHVVEIIGKWFYQGDVILADEVKVIGEWVEPMPKEWNATTIVEWLSSHNGAYTREAREVLCCLTRSPHSRQELIKIAKDRKVLNYLLPIIEDWLVAKDMILAMDECIQYMPERVCRYRFSLIEAICNSDDLTENEAISLIRRITEL